MNLTFSAPVESGIRKLLRLIEGVIDQSPRLMVHEMDCEPVQLPRSQPRLANRFVENRNNLLEIDDALRGNDENRYLLALKKTLYADFINAIANAVLEEYVRFLEDPKGHPDYTAPMMVKLADLTETASNLESQSIDHVISIFRKVRRGIWSAHDLAPKIKPAELPRDGEYQRLQNAQNFLFYALDSGVRANFKFYKKRAPYQTSLETERDAFGEMAKKMDELKATLKTTEDISLLSRFRVRGNSFLF